jgi:hypothetical protein
MVYFPNIQKAGNQDFERNNNVEEIEGLEDAKKGRT